MPDNCHKQRERWEIIRIGFQHLWTRVFSLTKDIVSVHVHCLTVYVPVANLAIFMSCYGLINTMSCYYTQMKGFGNVKSTVRHLVLELDEEVSLPSTDNVFYNNESHRFLLTIPGRGPICFRYNVIGHTRTSCDASYCRHSKEYTQSTEEYAARSREKMSQYGNIP